MTLTDLVPWLNRPAPYRARHFRRRETLRPDYRRLARALMQLVPFSSAVDVGCANAFLLEEFVDAGKEVTGVELSPEVVEVLSPEIRHAVLIGDFADLAGRWDLACCVEVAEHIPPPRSAELVDIVARIARRWIYFTAAPPGQPGRGHINCRPHDEWLEMFAHRGWETDEPRTARLRDTLASLETAVWLRGNSFLFGRSESEATLR